MAKSHYHPVIYKYLKRYQEDPTSRIFAPLAEAYRKAGLVDEAIEIARDGLKFHPHFSSGKVALARALFDKKLYQEVIDELSPIIQDIPDNLVAQRLMAESSLILGQVAAALSAYKMILFFAPHDPETAQIVQELEVQAYEKGTLVLRNDPSPIPQFTVQPATQAIDEDPAVKKSLRIQRIEFLQEMLLKIQRYRVFQNPNSPGFRSN